MAKKTMKKVVKKAAKTVEPKQEAPKLLLNLGCGPSRMEGYVGVDARNFESGSVDVVCDLGKDKWPWADSSVDAAHASHLIEHLKPEERIHFVNELDRVLKPGAKCLMIAPYWSSMRAYGDLTHQWPPISEFWFMYLNAEWRKLNAAHNDSYTCDLEVSWGFNLHPEIDAKAEDAKGFAMRFYKEAQQDIVATLGKKSAPAATQEPVVLEPAKAKKRAKK